jgi:hypothetical protein
MRLFLVVLLAAPPLQAAGRFLPGDSVRDRARAGASVSSERGVNALQVNPALLGMADNLSFALGWTNLSENSEFDRGSPYVGSLEDQTVFNQQMANYTGSSGLAQSAYSERLLRAGMVYGFGTSGFRMGLGYAELPVENHRFEANDPQRYRLIRSADEREQLSLGLAGAFGRRFALGFGLHWERLRRVRRLMINTSQASDGNYFENPNEDHLVDITGTVPIGFGDSAFVPTASFGLWARLFAGLELGLSVALGGTGVAEDGNIDVLDLEPRDADDSTSPIFARRGVSETVSGTQATLTDGSPLQIRAGMRYQFSRFDLEFEWRMESWSADSQMRASPSATGLAWFPTPAEESEEGVELGDMGDARALESAMSFHVGSDIWLVPNGLALRFGGSMEYAPSTQPDAAMFAGPRYGVGAGLSFADRGYAIDLGYYHLFTEAIEMLSGSLPVRNPAHTQAEAESDVLSVQNNGKYTSSHGFFGLGLRADMTTFSSHRKSQRKAWYQIWSKGSGGFGRGGF